MICPKCMVQMHQNRTVYPERSPVPIGGGVAEDDRYITWTLQECPQCKRLTVEFYEAIVVQSVEEAIATAQAIESATDHES